MGLVSTWLNGIGLNNAVPTFQAAGIVTPAALAELDVAHFEALGISDPDDRRKLFYLVQRIKMAVNKDKPKASVEAQVDAVISGTIENPEDDPAEKKEEKREEKLVASPAPTRKKNLPPESPEPRRSRRLAAKSEVMPKSPAKENRSLQNSPKKSIPNSPKKPTKSQTQRETTTATTRRSQTESREEKRSIDDPPADEDNDDDWEEPEQEDEEEEVPPARPTRRQSKAATARRISGSEANAVFNLENEDELSSTSTSRPRRISSSSIASKERQRSGLKQPKLIAASSSLSDGESVGDSNEPKQLQTPTSKRQEPKTRRPESKLQNPGKSMRTGKSLSVIPAEKIAPMSPLDDLPTSNRDQDVDEKASKTMSRIKPAQGRRQTSASSGGGDALDELLQSSASDMESVGEVSETEIDNVSFNQIPKLNKSRSKSMGTPDSAMLGRTSGSSRLPRQTSRNSSSKSDLSSSLNSSGRGKQSISGSLKAPSSCRSDGSLRSRGKPSSAPFVHGGTQSESWVTKVEDLRDDNNAEHELFRDQADEQLYLNDMRIRVIVRKRPVSKVEASLTGGIDVIHPFDYGDYGRVMVYQPKTRVDLTKEVETIPFAYDNIFDETSTNTQIYQRSLRNLIIPFFKGQWSTVFAYGQTGSGKTYTMMGSNMTGINAGTATDDEANLGLYYLAALDIFEMVKRPEYRHLSVQVSLFEIYGGKLFDLLNGRKQIKCLEDSKGKVCFPGLTEHPAQGPDRLMELIEEGATNRSTGTTSRNADSSRSHAVLQLKLRKDVGRRKNVEHGRLNFIDLAGSERGADTSSASRATRLEGAEINTSLLALKEVIRALATGGSMTHIPFRGSKLTQVLKDSFVGKDSRCCMVACISPDIGNCEQTLNTLRYADRVKERDPESGALSSSYEQPIRLNPIQMTSQLEKQESSEEQAVPVPESFASSSQDTEDSEDSESSVTKPYQSDADMAVLDDLLSTSPHERPQMVAAPASPIASATKHKAGESLVAAHRAVMASMLTMVKDEMTLVNTVDADRDGLDDYLAELQNLQSTQLDLISKLRGSLRKYVSAAEGSEASSSHVESDDESFEDLRD